VTRLTEADPSADRSLYDRVPYPGYPYAQTDPDRLATLATLFGLEPPALETCRVLELGCGDAANLVSLAVSYPDASFLGVDAAQSAVARARALVAALGLTNVALEEGALERMQPTSGGFDYVIAHGVYSWVAPPVRDRCSPYAVRPSRRMAWPTSVTTPSPAGGSSRQCARCSPSTRSPSGIRTSGSSGPGRSFIC